MYKHVFSSRLENSVDPDQLASQRPADLDLLCLKIIIYLDSACNGLPQLYSELPNNISFHQVTWRIQQCVWLQINVLTADPGVVSLIPARSHNFVEIH